VINPPSFKPSMRFCAALLSLSQSSSARLSRCSALAPGRFLFHLAFRSGRQSLLLGFVCAATAWRGGSMSFDELERILSAEKGDRPLIGLVSSVMDAVCSQAAAAPPIPFP
jgi:hypothetical protein